VREEEEDGVDRTTTLQGVASEDSAALFHIGAKETGRDGGLGKRGEGGRKGGREGGNEDGVDRKETGRDPNLARGGREIGEVKIEHSEMCDGGGPFTTLRKRGQATSTVSNHLG